MLRFVIFSVRVVGLDMPALADRFEGKTRSLLKVQTHARDGRVSLFPFHARSTPKYWTYLNVPPWGAQVSGNNSDNHAFYAGPVVSAASSPAAGDPWNQRQ